MTFSRGTPWPWKCQQCASAPCVEACVSGSLVQQDGQTGVAHHPETCVGCGSCLLVCPFSAAIYDGEAKTDDEVQPLPGRDSSPLRYGLPEQGPDLQTNRRLCIGEEEGICSGDGEGSVRQTEKEAQDNAACGYGLLGLCCSACLQGPCRLTPFDEDPVKGLCGDDRDLMVARNLLRLALRDTFRAIRDLKEAVLETGSLSPASPLVEETTDLLSPVSQRRGVSPLFPLSRKCLSCGSADLSRNGLPSRISDQSFSGFSRRRRERIFRGGRNSYSRRQDVPVSPHQRRASKESDPTGRWRILAGGGSEDFRRTGMSSFDTLPCHHPSVGRGPSFNSVSEPKER